ncbi:MAG: pilus assembly protein PilM [Candidatus Omnitrophota bacterium]|nr:MAG: pilus assembly protein PilM [Candidatus Omnitrophota bacterium]
MELPFKRKKKIITVLQIDNDWLKIVQAESFANIRKINKIIIEKFEQSSDDKISARLGSLSKELNIASDFLVICVPHQLTAIRNLELPSINSAEIKDMVTLQVGKQTPFTKDEIIYDYQVLDTNAEGYSRVMLAIVHQDVVRQYIKVLEKAQLKTERVALSPEGLFAWHRFARREKAENKPCALIDVNYDKSNFTVILKDKLIFCRNISIGYLQSINKMEEWQKKFIEEITHSIYACQSEMIDKEIYKVIITGAEMLTAGLDEGLFKAQLGLPIEIIPQLENIPITREVIEQYNASTRNTSISALCGFALSYPEQKVNLVPAQLLIEKSLKERGKDLYVFGMCLVFILAAISSIFLGRMYNKQQYLARLKQEESSIKGKVARLDNMMKEINAMKRRSLTKNFSLNFIYEIHRAILPEIYLDSLNFNGKMQLTLRGTSTAMPAVITFRQALEESKYFQDVNTKFATTRKEGAKELTDFEIVCPLETTLRQQLTEWQE